MTHRTNVDRRTVLRSLAAGTAAVGGLATAGTTAADHLQVGDCARLMDDYQSFVDACPTDGNGPVFESGTEGLIWDSCTNQYGTVFYQFSSNSDFSTQGWVEDAFLERC